MLRKNCAKGYISMNAGERKRVIKIFCVISWGGRLLLKQPDLNGQNLFFRSYRPLRVLCSANTFTHFDT